MDNQNLDAKAFWEDLYSRTSKQTNGNPSAVLSRFVSERPTGDALELGCARGDDAVWLAERGWQVTGVDISANALDIAAQNAEKNGVLEKISFAQHDLSSSFPKGSFDLVSAIFLQAPFDFPRVAVLQRAAAAVKQNGLLLITAHQKVASWSWGDPNIEYPDAQQHLAELELTMEEWREVFVGPVERIVRHKSSGQAANITDAVIALERL
ncbi:MAG: class I SAM-dependent methyltransferase [Lentilitoribacter sp.]